MKAQRPPRQDLAQNCNFSKICHLQSQNEGEGMPMKGKMVKKGKKGKKGKRVKKRKKR